MFFLPFVQVLKMLAQVILLLNDSIERLHPRLISERSRLSNRTCPCLRTLCPRRKDNFFEEEIEILKSNHFDANTEAIKVFETVSDEAFHYHQTSIETFSNIAVKAGQEK